MITNATGFVESILLQRTDKPSRNGHRAWAIVDLVDIEGMQTTMELWPEQWRTLAPYILAAFHHREQVTVRCRNETKLVAD